MRRTVGANPQIHGIGPSIVRRIIPQLLIIICIHPIVASFVLMAQIVFVAKSKLERRPQLRSPVVGVFLKVRLWPRAGCRCRGCGTKSGVSCAQAGGR